jgi:hypothetical protein
MRVNGTPTVITEDAQGQMWVCTQQGRVYCEGSLVLDIGSKLVPLNSLYDERGLLGLALHPTRRNVFYLYYSAPGNTGLNIFTASGWNEDKYTSVATIEEYEGQQPLRVILQIKQPLYTHNGKDVLQFRPSDGSLIFAIGDSNGEFDLFNLAQNDAFVHGKTLAINVSTVPVSTALISRTAQLPASIVIENKGLRNPVSVDIVPATAQHTETTFIAMAGQNLFEFAVAYQGTGNNFGWRKYEGPEPTKLPLNIPVFNDPDFPYHRPFVWYSHYDPQFFNLLVVMTAGKVIGETFYFLDWMSGLYRCTPNFQQLETQVPFEKVVLGENLSSYTALGRINNKLWVGGLKNGQGMVVSLD